MESATLNTLHVLGLMVLIFLVAFPFYWMIIASLKPLIIMAMNPLDLWPQPGELTLRAYKEVWFQFRFWRFFVNSAYVSSLTVLFTVALATLAAYSIARLRFRGRAFLSRSILMIYMFPAIVIAVPLYALFTKFGLRNDLHGLVLVYLAQTLPVAIYMLYSYFKTLPPDLEEAGLIDGCSRFGVIWRITVPLSLPAMISVVLYTFMIAWNEFLFAFLFLDSPSRFTLSRGIMQIADNINVSQQLLMAAAVIATLPIVILFLMLEKYLVKGLTAGGVKG
ncbi:MAG: carbohydrate ABC transporter permease [Deltaproteobacteria bacterium]|nr:carbohydrate ABC transporter permease [Deltaproteobacteria bacterium]MBW1960256.1 carbohydrate ABC transporter permease [Deltaproteobacteria bacterium]MBW2154230.1 carbohydrate ABC transporter permease [Deltaproteobacteria bacterium]